MPFDIGDLVVISRTGAEAVSVEWHIRDVLLLPGDDFSTRSGLFTFDITVGIRGSGGVEKRRELFSSDGIYHKWDRFCSRSELKKRKSMLMPDSILMITCHLKRAGAAARGERFLQARGIRYIGYSSSEESDEEIGEDVIYYAYQPRPAPPPPSPTFSPLKEEPVCAAAADRCQFADKQGVEKAMEDFAQLFTGGEDSDVTIQVSGREFRVHRNILRAQCPVFSAMFRHNTQEKASNRIVVEDCEPDVFEQYLRYLYTGDVDCLSRHNVFGLFVVADRYLAEDLRQRCVKHIGDTLCFQNFCDTVKLALMHGESDLLRLADNFASKNFLAKSTEWQSFIQEFPEKAEEILVQCVSASHRH